jgi:hypothetical protein
MEAYSTCCFSLLNFAGLWEVKLGVSLEGGHVGVKCEGGRAVELKKG